MSSQQRDPLWYCHQCNTEMRPLMTPEPQCENCHGTFVEKIEDPEDDPRDFHQAGFNPTNDPLRLFASLLGQQEHRHRSPTNSDQDTPRRSFSPLMPGSFQMEFGTSNGRTFIVGGPNTLFPRRRSFDRENETPGANPPTLHDFLRIAREETESDNDRRPSIPGNLMAQYLFALLAGAPAGVTGGANSPGSGRWGDYIFSQDALDRLITQIMENSNVNRPVPAPEGVVENLPRKVLELGDPLLENDCAVCKEQFDAKAAEPSEQIVITLPCKHAFHEGCILPWLKSSGTCPVCRFALVPQPNSHSHEAGPSASSSSPPPSGGTHPTRRRSSSDRSSSNDNIMSTTNSSPSEQMNTMGASSSSDTIPGAFPGANASEEEARHQPRSSPVSPSSTLSTSSRSSGIGGTAREIWHSIFGQYRSGSRSSHSSSSSHHQ